MTYNATLPQTIVCHDISQYNKIGLRYEFMNNRIFNEEWLNIEGTYLFLILSAGEYKIPGTRSIVTHSTHVMS